MTRKLAVVAAGGTGGHLFPAEALARTLADRGWRIVLATDARGAVYAEHFPAEERIGLDAATARSGDPFGMVRAGVKVTTGVRQATAAFRRLKPAVVVGFGGYPALPAMLAGIVGGLPTVIHEQNAVLGRVNRFIAPRVTAVACAFPTLEKAAPAVRARMEVVGNPVRPEIQALADRAYAPPGDVVRVLVTGGSQGAKLLSETTPQAIALLPEALRRRLHVAQQTRADSSDFARDTYARAGVEAEVAPFFRDMASLLRDAHLMIGRAGASTVCELAVAGLPSVLIPLRIAMDDHQRFNAKLLTDAGAAEVVLEPELTPERLADVLSGLLADPEGLARRAAAARSVAKPDAADRLADVVERVARPS
jgi:UDP-N-acetylglucosamine--N-acetylmuramyl-(pentapeptide) pyrophosphoryl-undecaprenol N-acetylglucosamine transferase